MAYELTGTIKKIFERQDFSSGFYKREFVVTTDERFPQDIALECLKEKVEMLDSVQEGTAVKVSFDIRGREWNEKYFVNLAAWKIEEATGEGAADGQPEQAAQPAEDPAQYGIDEDEEVPF